MLRICGTGRTAVEKRAETDGGTRHCTKCFTHDRQSEWILTEKQNRQRDEQTKE